MLQFAVNLADCAGMPELAVLGVAIVGAFALLAAFAERPCAAAACDVPVEPSRDLTRQACWSVALIVIIATLFSALDNVVTLSNARGAIALQTWPRLFLAASGLLAGLIFDLAERRYIGLVMFGVTALSSISILAVEAGADPTFGLIIFYLSSGFFVTFFTATFAQLAPHMCVPELWAGMGRAANNLCAFTVSGVSMMLTQSGIAAVMIASLILFVLVSVAFVGAGLFRLPSTVGEREAIKAGLAAAAAPTVEEMQAEFISRSGLTPREEEVLRAVTADERPLKQVADDLGISLRMVQRHLTNIYSKTDTQTRAGLTRAFFGSRAAAHEKAAACQQASLAHSSGNRTASRRPSSIRQ